MKFLIGIDRTVLKFYEVISHALQRLTGYNNFWLAWIALCFIAAVSAWQVSRRILKMEIGWAVVGIASIMLLVFIVPLNLKRLEGLVSRGTTRFRNILESSNIMITVRLCILIALVLTICNYVIGVKDVTILRLLHGVAVTSMFYLISVTPLPPCDGKVGQWLLLLLGKRSQA